MIFQIIPPKSVQKELDRLVGNLFSSGAKIRLPSMVPDNQNSNVIFPNAEKKIVWESPHIGSSVISHSFVEAFRGF